MKKKVLLKEYKEKSSRCQKPTQLPYMVKMQVLVEGQ